MWPILQKLDQTVTSVLETTGAEQINLVGHSAGGWIARIYLGEKPYAVHRADINRQNVWAAYPQVKTLITLGTPHTSQERWTRRNLDFVNGTYPRRISWVGELRLRGWQSDFGGSAGGTGLPTTATPLPAGYRRLLGRRHYPHFCCPPAGGR